MCGCRQSTQSHTQSQGASRRAAPSPSASSPSAPSASASRAIRSPRPAQASVLLLYHGARALLVRGPVTGAGYACYPRETIQVHASDVPHLLASGAFARAT